MKWNTDWKVIYSMFWLMLERVIWLGVNYSSNYYFLGDEESCYFVNVLWS